jgi:hypothetical protein
VQRVAPRLPLLLSNAFELMCLFCAPGTHDQKCTVVPFISTCYFARVVANTLCDVGFASRGLRFRVTRILEMGVPMTRDSVESWIKSHILSLSTRNSERVPSLCHAKYCVQCTVVTFDKICPLLMELQNYCTVLPKRLERAVATSG